MSVCVCLGLIVFVCFTLRSKRVYGGIMRHARVSSQNAIAVAAAAAAAV